MIRAAESDDFVAIAAITNHYIATTTIHLAYEPLSADDFRAMWAPARYPWLVADEGDVIGYAKAGRWRERAAYQWTAEIGLYVADGVRGNGVGRALYTELLAELTARGFRSVIACVTLPNDPSTALHRAFGFDSVGTVREAGYKLGAWHDVELWQKRLATAAGDAAGEPPPVSRGDG